jgi:hypothetical protein
MSKHRELRAKSPDREVTFQHHETDSPTLPVPQLQQLHQFRPDRVDWVFEQTEIEAQQRRREAQRINTFVFFERIIGMVFAFLIGSLGLIGAIWLAYKDHEWAASSIGGITLVSLVSAFIFTSRQK